MSDDVRKVTVYDYPHSVNCRLTSNDRSSMLSNNVKVIAGTSYLVDPASSHMLVSKIKPCMSKFKRLHCKTADGSLYQL